MPFSPESSTKYKKNLSSSGSKERWASIANSILKETGDEGKAIRIANSKSQGSSPITRDSVSRKLKRTGFPR